MPGKYHLAFLIILPFLSNAVLAAECDLDAISKALEAPLDSMKPYEREVAVPQSTEGGVWQIFREKDGRLNTVIRIDGGESGRNETRLSTVNRNAWGIASTRVDYNRHAFAENGGPFAVLRKTTTYFFFCDGKLYTPPPEWSVADDQYTVAADEAKNEFFKAQEISEFIKGLAR
jgi:hypothetical protein